MKSDFYINKYFEWFEMLPTFLLIIYFDSNVMKYGTTQFYSRNITRAKAQMTNRVKIFEEAPQQILQQRIPIYFDFYEDSFKRKLIPIDRLQITSRAVLFFTKIKCFQRLKLSIIWNNFCVKKNPPKFQFILTFMKILLREN